METLFHHTNTAIPEEEDRVNVIKHLKGVLHVHSYKPWMFKIPAKQNKERRPGITDQQKHPTSVPLSYVKGESEKLAWVFRMQRTNTYNLPFNVIKSQIVHLKDPTSVTKKCGIVYKLECADFGTENILAKQPEHSTPV